MGIRVHRAIGYGLTDLRTEEGKGWNIQDERINMASPAIRRECPPIGDFRRWLEEHLEAGDISSELELFMLRDREESQGKKPLSLEGTVIHDGEYGLENVLLVVPPTYEDMWTRYDDPIDWIDETYIRQDVGSQANWVKELRHGIYPFIGYMDKRTGEKLDDRIFHWIRGTNRQPKPNEQVLDELAEECGFSDSADALENVAPIVPEDIQNVVAYLELFNDPDSWRDLRPIMYTYWS